MKGGTPVKPLSSKNVNNVQGSAKLSGGKGGKK